jgi:hypothetical protein
MASKGREDMDPIITNSNRRVRLSKEELLAGYCFPDNPAPLDNDPRIKSPDLILEKHSAGTPINLPAAKPVSPLEKKLSGTATTLQ